MEKKTKNHLYKKIINNSKPNFPLLYTSPYKKSNKKIKENNNDLNNKNTNLFNSMRESFLKRNYDSYIEKINNQNNNLNNNILSKKELDSILFNLKQDYNLITTITQKRNDEIIKLNTTLETEQEKLKKIIDFQEIELPEEKISLKKIGDTKMTKEEIEKHLRDLVNEKSELDYKVNIANEYSKTVKYMLDNEKKKVLNIQDETNQIQEKLKNFNRYHNLISDNLNKTKVKNNNFFELSEKLQNDINLADKVINNNNEKKENLKNDIISKEEKVDDLKQKMKLLKAQNEEEFERYKENIYEKIQKTKEDKEEKIKREKEYIDIIYCLYILQKYFIEKDIFDYSELLLSKEYKTIINQNYEIKINNKNENNMDNDNNKNISFNNKPNNEESINKDIISKSELNNPTNINHTINKDKSFKKNIILNLDEITHKFDEINLSKKSIFDYISRLSSKISFNKNSLDNFHKKEISLIEKKEQYFEKVQNIINNDYLNFEEITKNNSKFNSFLNKNYLFIEEKKNQNRINNLNEINKQLNLNEIDKDNKKLLDININININKLSKNNIYNNLKEKNNIINKEQIIINANDLYKKSNKLIMSHNNFLDNISDILNNIIISIQNIYNEKMKNDINNDKNILSENEFIKSIMDKQKTIIEFQNLINRKISTNSINFIKYIKDLIEYNNNNVKKKLDKEELNKNLLFLFYKEKEKETINELFYNQFISKNIPNQNNIFNHFYTISNKTFNIIKSILDLLKENENFLDNYISNNTNLSPSFNSIKKLSHKALNSYSIFDYSTNSLKNFPKSPTAGTASPIFKKIKIRKSLISLDQKERKENQNNSAWVEDKETSFESEIVPKEEKVFKRRINYIEKNIVNNLYKPSFEKSNYLRKLNTNMKMIKNMTFNYSRFNFIMKQKRNEIDLMGQQMLLYNNPKLRADELYKPIYDNINNLMMNKRKFNVINSKEKRFKSTSTNRKTKNKI